MEDVTVQGVKYKVKPIPPRLVPYSQFIGAKLYGVPRDLAEAESNGPLIVSAMQRLLGELVDPQPPEEHRLAVFNALVQITDKAVAGAKFLRDDSKRDGEAGNGVGDAVGDVAKSGAAVG